MSGTVASIVPCRQISATSLHSTCPSKCRGGDLGWFGPGKMVAAFENTCKRLSPGSASDLVSPSFGYHVIKLTGKR